MPIIVGAPRSGTTLLRFILDAHPDLAIPPETGFLALDLSNIERNIDPRAAVLGSVTGYPRDAPGWADFGIDATEYHDALDRIEPFDVAEGIRAFYRLYAGRFSKHRWGDKTPVYAFHLESIGALLPEAHFIHLVRDGRDVAASWQKMWFSPGDDIETLARSWREIVMAAREQGKHCRHYLEVSYEDLVLRPRATIEEVCRYLSLSYDDSMARYFERAPDRLREHRSRYRIDGSLLVSHQERLHQQRNVMRPLDSSLVFGWKERMSDGERSRFEAVAGDQLRALGYETRG